MASVGGARVAGIAITSLTFPFLVRRLGVEIYGLWSYVIAVCAFLEIIANPGLTTYTVQQVAARRHAASDVIWDVTALRFFSSLIAIGALLIVAGFEKNPEIRHLLRWYGMGIFFVNLTGADFLLGALEMFHARSLLMVIQQGLYAAGIFVFIRSPKDVIWVPISILGSAFLTNLAGWAVLWKQNFRPQLALHPERWKEIFIPSAHYAVSTLMSSLYHRTGHIVVRWFLGEYALGLYAAAVRFVDILKNFVNIVLGVLMPRIALSSKSEEDMKRLARFAMEIMAGLSIPLAVGLISTAHLVVPWVLGAQYREVVPLMKWMAFYLLTASAASLFSGTILYAMGRHRAYLISAAAGAVAGVSLFLVLVPWLGLTGACLAFVLGELAVAIVAYSQIPRGLRGLWKNPLIGVFVIAALVMAVAVKLVTLYSSRPLIVVFAGACVYAILSGWFIKKWLMEQLRGTV